MKNKILLAAMLAVGSISVQAETVDQRLERLEKELAETQKALNETRQEYKQIQAQEITPAAPVANAGSGGNELLDGLEIHGYARAGVLFGDGGEKVNAPSGHDNGAFVHPGSPFLHNWRLGNETDNYAELALSKKFDLGDSWAKFNFRLANKDGMSNTYRSASTSTITDSAGKTFTVLASKDRARDGVMVREAFVELGGIDYIPKGSTLWAGKRFYGRDDSHISDWYWRIHDGTGIGLDNIQIGNAALDLAYLNNEGAAGNAKDIHTLYGKFKNIKVGSGSMDFDVTAIKTSDNVNNTATSDNAADMGFGTSASYNFGKWFGVLPGNNKVFAMYGHGAAADLGANGADYLYKKANAFALGTTGLVEGEKLDVFTELSGRYSTDLYGEGGDVKWVGLGVRPVYKVSKNFSVATELGYDWGGYYNADGSTYKGYVAKATLAPTWSLDAGNFWGRPQIRAFATYSKWADTFKGNTGSNAGFGDKTNGMTYGVQTEVWF